VLAEGMDLSEVRGSHSRHPWETARAVAIERILREAAIQPRAILDYGCGDGFTGERVFSAVGAERLVGFDIYLTEQQCAARSHGAVRYSNDWAQVGPEPFDLCLLCDVIEHVVDDGALLKDTCQRLNPDGYALITVPAFQVLFSSHDRALKHFRRYTLPQLRNVITAAGFSECGSGYLFGSLIPGRALALALEAMAPKRDDFGIGAWNGSPTVTRGIEALLNFDNSVLLALASRGIHLPGLSAWALCKKRPS
jgi:SAM-dependent methyltransferase